MSQWTFLEAKRLLGSKVEYLTLDVNELSARRLGQFDLVLFFGVLYHLRHPLLGLEKVVELSRGLALIESFVIDPGRRLIPTVMEFYEGTELGGQLDNWCSPSPECLLAMCRSAGFAQVEMRDITNQRASVLCRRHWPEPDAVPSTPAPLLDWVASSRTSAARFHLLKEEALCLGFQSAEPDIRACELLVEVDGFGTQVHSVAVKLGRYAATCLRPPGLNPGKHVVRIRTRRSGRSNPVEFEMVDE